MLEPQQRGAPAEAATASGHAQTDDLGLPGFFDDDDGWSEADEVLKKRAPWWRRPPALIAGGLLVIVLAGVAVAVLRSRPQPATYTFGTVRTGNLVVSITATGPLQSAVYDVNFSGSGKIAEIDVAVGQQVKAGQVLAKLDPTSLQDAVNSAQTNLNNAERNLGLVEAQTQASVNAAYQQEQTTLNTTCKASNAPTNCVQAAEAQLASAQAQANSQVAQSQEQVASDQQALTTAQHNLGDATLTAPHAGIVGAINGSVGGTPGASSGSSGSSGTFIEIVDLSSFQVTANVNEADIGKVAVGQTATFTVSAYSNRRFSGAVSAISPIGQTSSNVVTYPVTITVDTSTIQGATLFPQMTANVTIITAQRLNALLVPAQAITFARSEVVSGAISRSDIVSALQQARQMAQTVQSSDPNAATDTPTASFVLERANGQWVVKPIVVGLTDGTSYDVLAGLSDGDSVVTAQSGGAASSATPAGSLFPGGRISGGGGGRNGGFGGGNGGG